MQINVFNPSTRGWFPSTGETIQECVENAWGTFASTHNLGGSSGWEVISAEVRVSSEVVGGGKIDPPAYWVAHLILKARHLSKSPRPIEIELEVPPPCMPGEYAINLPRA